jgi:saccharopine dehydrogenase-like NADP-dependent oxidoreductase
MGSYTTDLLKKAQTKFSNQPIGRNIMHKIVIIGAGKIGFSIAKMLFNASDYEVTLADNNAELISKLSAIYEPFRSRLLPNLNFKVVDVSNADDLSNLFDGQNSVLSACPYTANVAIATAALKAGISYFDLTEDRYTTAAIQEMASQCKEGQVFMPQCGLAPGFIGILAHDVFTKLDAVHDLKMRVGALPLYPSNRLKYNLTWSTEGLINEYSNPCDAIVNFTKMDTIPLEEVETFSMDGVEYEAFNTSGGLGTLCETLENKVRNMNYKTLRYPGHVELMKFLIKDLNMGEKGENRDMLRKVFDKNLPTTPQDVVLAFCTVKGLKDGKLTELTRIFRVTNQDINGEPWTAIQVTTASGACVAIDLHAQGKLPGMGFVKQEDIKLDDLLSNQFGNFYRDGELSGDKKTSPQLGFIS